MMKKKSSVGVVGRMIGAIRRVRLSANDGAMIFAYETLGALLSKRFDAHRAPALAAGSAIIIDPEAQEVFAHLSRNAEQVQIVAAARLLREAFHHVTAEYLQPEEPGAQWRLKIDCVILVDGKRSQASLTRTLDWSELPDIVRGSYMREERDSYLLTLVSLPDDEDRP